MPGPLLRVEKLTKRFGGFVANDAIDLEIARGEIVAVIGPNGAGKTTLVSQIAGEIAPSQGRIFADGRDITALSPPQRAALGLARSFQITSIFKSFSALENVALAIQVRRGHSFRFLAPAHSDPGLNGPALDLLAQVGIAERAPTVAARLSHGEHRQLEIAMALATEPKLMMLDEPTAGMGPEEAAAMVKLLGALRGRYAILLIEHDMDVVFALAQRIVVLVDGRVIAAGRPREIRDHPEVRAAYLGESEIGDQRSEIR